MPQSSEQSAFRPSPENTPMPLAQARARIVDAITPIADTERVALQNALHRVLAERVIAGVDVPGADNSSMDGYGYRAGDVDADGAALDVVGESLAGHPFAGRVGAGQCVRIMTGAVVPDGVDTVVMQENTRAAGERVRARARLQARLGRRGDTHARDGEATTSTLGDAFV